MTEYISLGIGEYIGYLASGVQRPIRFFIIGRWADEVWKSISLFSAEEPVSAERVLSEESADIIIETHDRLYFDMNVGPRWEDGNKRGKQNNIQDCVCEIALFKRYEFQPDAAAALLKAYNEDERRTFDTWREYPEHQAQYFPRGPRLAVSAESIYLQNRLPEGALGSCWVDVLGSSWVEAYIMIVSERLRAEKIANPTNDILQYMRSQLSADPWINGYADQLSAAEWKTVFAGIKVEARNQRRTEQVDDTGPVSISEGWLGLREMSQELFRSKGMSERDITICSHWLCPAVAGETLVDLRKRLVEDGLIDHGILQASFNDVIRRKISQKGSLISNTELGRLGEAFTHRLLVASLECWVGPQASGVCDISDAESGDPGEAGWALNVKLSLEDDVNRSFEVSPEHQVRRSWVLLLMPRSLQMRLYPIAGELTTVNSRSGVYASPEGLAEQLKGLIAS